MGEMLYRKVGRTGDEVNVIGVGTSSNGPAGAEETVRAVTMALDNGVNYFDLAAADGLTFEAFGGGQLVDASLSPFGRSLTTAQCIQYALDRPGVVTVLAGIRDRRDLEGALSYLDSSPEDRDYSVIGDFAPPDAEGKCIYCNHCQPCPSGLDIGLINKYYDLARAGDRLAADHYANLAVKAGACTACGHCDDTCPFNVGQVARMAEIREYFDG